MATAHHFHVRSDHVGARSWHVSFIAVGAVTAVCAVLALGSIGSSGDTAVVDLDVEPAVVDTSKLTEPTSALLDGRAFAAAVQAVLSGVHSSSILLDGAAFELAVHEAVASVTNGSALLHGTGFVDAVTRAVTAAAD